MDGELEQRIVDAALAEFASQGVDDFRLEGAARRAGVEPSVILEHWHDRRVLLLDAMLKFTRSGFPAPDTGSLRGDLEAIMHSLTAIGANPLARRLFHRTLPNGRDPDLFEVGHDFWKAREDTLRPILQRAAQRGEVRDGIPPEAILMFTTALTHNIFFFDTPIHAGWADLVLDTFLRGITATPQEGNHRRELHVENVYEELGLMRAAEDAAVEPWALLQTVRDLDGRVIDFVYRDINSTAARQQEGQREDLRGRTVTETLPEVANCGLLGMYVHCIDTGQPLILDDFSYYGRTLDGSGPEARRYDIRAVRVDSEHLSLTWRDVTRRYRNASHTPENAEER